MHKVVTQELCSTTAVHILQRLQLMKSMVWNASTGSYQAGLSRANSSWQAVCTP